MPSSHNYDVSHVNRLPTHWYLWRWICESVYWKWQHQTTPKVTSNFSLMTVCSLTSRMDLPRGRTPRERERTLLCLLCYVCYGWGAGLCWWEELTYISTYLFCCFHLRRYDHFSKLFYIVGLVVLMVFMDFGWFIYYSVVMWLHYKQVFPYYWKLASSKCPKKNERSNNN